MIIIIAIQAIKNKKIYVDEESKAVSPLAKNYIMMPLSVKLVLLVFLLLAFIPARAYSQGYCFEEAGQEYSISPALLRAISSTEWKPGESLINYNTNGTYDYCHMQINSSWATVLGSESWSALGDPCFCTRVGAWILAQCIARYGYTWEAVGCYHSERESKRIEYAWRVQKILNKHGEEQR